MAALSWSGLHGCALDDRVLVAQGGGAADAAPPQGAPGSGLGLACTAAAECASGFCVDGVCCDTGCADVCASCNAPGTEGICSPLSSDPLCTALQCPQATECRGLDTTQAGSNCEGIGVCRRMATCQITNVQAGTSCQNGTGACDGDGACLVEGKLRLATLCTANADCAEGFCPSDGAASMCCDAACDGACQKCSPAGHCELAPAADPRCPVVTCPASNVCREYGGELSGACHGFAACATATDCTFTELRPAADCTCDAQGGCTLLRGKECEEGSQCASGVCAPTLGGGKPVCCASACGTGLSCASDGSACVECAGTQVSCDGATELRCQPDGLFARTECPFGCADAQGCNPLPGLGLGCDAATGCLDGLPCQADATGALRCCSRDCAAEGRICAENGSCVCPPDQLTSGAECLLRAGDPCTLATECDSSQCVDGVCCGEPCAGACESCQAGTGACEAVAAGQQDSVCGAGQQCTGTRGECRSNLLEACTVDAGCASSHCATSVAGGLVCCAVACAPGTACSSDGQRCVACEPNFAVSCGNGCNAQTFTCNPPRPVGEPCGAGQQCASGQCLVDDTAVSRCCEANCAAEGKVCDSSGACLCPPNQIEVDGQCRVARGQACADDASCSTGACALAIGGGRRCCATACSPNELCAPDGSACIDQRGEVGAGCNSPADCQNGNCVNEVCCAGACGACQRCQQGSGLCQADTSVSCTLASGAPGTCTASGCVDPGVGPGQLCGDRPCQTGLVCTASGVCCNSPCNGACESACSPGSGACNTPATDARCGATSCSAGLCQSSQALQANRSCVGPGECSTVDECSAPVGTTGGGCTQESGAPGECVAGSCNPVLGAAGDACEQGADCAGGSCLDGICCAEPCSAPCGTCAPGSGACVPAAPQEACGNGQLCIGTTCTTPTVRCSGQDVVVNGDDVCCNIIDDVAVPVHEAVLPRAECPPVFLESAQLPVTTPVTCDDPGDCPTGQICCLRSAQDSAIECTPIANCGGPFQICQSPVASSSEFGACPGVCGEFFLGQAFVSGWAFCG